MTSAGPILVAIHVTANVVWIGSILAVGRLLAAAEGDAKIRGVLARRVYRSLAVPAFATSFVAGALRLALSPDYYFVATHFMHAKLLLALVVIALHHVIGGRAKKAAAAAGDAAAAATGTSAPALELGLAVAAAGAIFLAVMKPF
jgi:putative membrane protein